MEQPQSSVLCCNNAILLNIYVLQSILSFQKGRISSLFFTVNVLTFQILQYSDNRDFFHLCSIIPLFKGLTGPGSSHISCTELTLQYFKYLYTVTILMLTLAHKIKERQQDISEVFVDLHIKLR